MHRRTHYKRTHTHAHYNMIMFCPNTTNIHSEWMGAWQQQWFSKWLWLENYWLCIQPHHSLFPPIIIIRIHSIRFGFVYCQQRQQHHFQNVINSIDLLKWMTNSRCVYFTWFYGLVTSLLQRTFRLIFDLKRKKNWIWTRYKYKSNNHIIKMKMNDF